jgi:predicted flap endonuclease-1-like 5' DNA nuclease
MTERFASDLGFILFVLIVAALLGFLIGFYCRRIRRSRFLVLENENEQLKIKLDASMKQLDACHKQLDACNMQLDDCNKQLDDCKKQKQEHAFDASAAREAFNMKIVEDDLKIVEGIGEKIDAILKKNGIVTWYQLSQISPDKITEILLTDGGPNYKIHDPGTWPAQALLAHEGKWKQLKDYQDQLNGGK